MLKELDGRGSNNTNKFNPQEQLILVALSFKCSNNTNKFNPQEQSSENITLVDVQIIQINSILKNHPARSP